MISNQERIKIIKEKIDENNGEISLNTSVAVQEECLHIYNVKNIYSRGKSVFLDISGIPYPSGKYNPPYLKKVGDSLNIREIKPRSVLFIMWGLLTKKEKADIALDHLYSDSEYEPLKRI
jgi:hypothetical protein